MIPNYTPDIRAVFQAENGSDYTLPVVVWSNDGEAVVPLDDGRLHVAHTLQGFQWLERDVKRPNVLQENLERSINRTA